MFIYCKALVLNAKNNTTDNLSYKVFRIQIHKTLDIGNVKAQITDVEISPLISCQFHVVQDMVFYTASQQLKFHAYWKTRMMMQSFDKQLQRF